MKLRNKVLLLSVMALSGSGLSAFKNAKAQEAGEIIKPSSTWAVTKISQGAEPYCTLVRQYDGGVVITLGQNYNEEYSLAIDFQKPKFDPEKSYPLTLQPGPGQLRAYEMIPASPGAMVVRLGWDESFLAALADSQMLKAEIDKQEYNFSFPDFVTGEKDLASCMNALKDGKKPSETQVASAEAPVDKADFKAKKVETKKVASVDKKEPRVVKAVAPSAAEVKADTKKLNKMAAELSTMKTAQSKLEQALAQEKQKTATLEKTLNQKNSGAQDAQKNLQEQLKAITSEKSALVAEQQKVAGQVATLTAEKEALEAQLVEKQKGASEEAKALEATKAEISALQEQNKTLTVALKQQEEVAMKKAAGVAGAEIVALKDELTNLTDKNVALVAENQSLKDLMAAKEKAKPVSITPDNSAELSKVQAELAAALSEKSSLLAELDKVKAELTVKPDVSVEMSAELSKVQAELVAALSEKDSLLAELTQVKSDALSKPDVSEEKNAEMASLQKELDAAKASLALKDKEIADASEKSNAAQSEKIAALEKRVEELLAENKKYFEEAKRTRSEVDNAKIELSNQAFTKVKKLEDKLEAAMADNISLTKQVEELSRMQDDVATGLADGDWNLEKATRRYNEAEKEIRRLGALLEQQRGGFRAEEKKLEDMLFDPAVADKKQRQKLAELERELSEARRLLAQRGVTPQERTMASREGSSTASSVTPMPRAPAQPVERVSSITPAAAPVMRAPVAPRVSPQPKASVTSAGLFGQTDIQSIISRSGIGAGSVTSAGANAYRWNAGSMSGYAQVVPKSQAGDVVQYAQNYINQQRSRCQGDFASVPGDSGRGKTTYEIACVGGNASTSSSLVFFEKSGSVVMIAHQTSADDMDVAMDARDKVVSQIK